MGANSKTIDKLMSFGLSLNEAVVYLSVVDNGSSKAGKIAKNIGMERSSCYQALNSLVNKGFVSYAVVGKVRFFQATSPKRFLERVKEQERLANELLPEIYKRHEENKLQGQVSLFKGKKGVKSVLMDIVREGKENRIFGGEGQLGDRMPTFKEIFVEKLKDNNIKVKELIRQDRQIDLESGRSVKFFPADIEIPVVTNIYGNKISIIIWTDIPEAILIENEAAAETYRSIFEFMWENAIEDSKKT